ncbi:hypothetical protein [Zoogloea sp.]|uniref:hypothetical protein n=1 Tax=Zoogloea sp. TaxID=49181 RepID=UPI001415C718|nr:MAG: hypothetical protein F9K15_16615 [Zoogloea sp.]
MKINLLPIGARFEYDGQIYTKTGPITATAEKGGQRMIPRHAALRPVDGYTPPPESTTRKLDEKTVLDAFEAYHATALRLAEGLGKAELEQARTKFLAALGH